MAWCGTPLSHTRVGIDFHWRDLLHFFFMPTRAEHIAQLEGRLEDLKAAHRKRESQLRNKKAHLPRPKNPAGGRKGNSQSERDWARIRSLLKKGVSEETLVRQLEAQRQDKPKPAYYAQRTVTRAAASLREEQSNTL